jgi:hypothetical protein
MPERTILYVKEFKVKNRPGFWGLRQNHVTRLQKSGVRWFVVLLLRSSNIGYLLTSAEVMDLIAQGLFELSNDGDYKVNENTDLIDSPQFHSLADLLALIVPVSTRSDVNKSLLTGVDGDFDEKVHQAQELSSDERRRRIAASKKIPQQVQTTTTTFLRNPYVAAEVLHRAAGICEGCKRPAPFKRASDGTPYLEVHHIKRLADGGEDTVENAIAVCPNCHRFAHYA